MKKSRILSIVLTTALLGLVLTACGKSQSSNKKHLNWSTNASIASLDPSKAVDTNTQQAVYNAFSGLVSPDGSNKVRLATAKSYHVSKDGKTYTFELKHTKWSNGKELTAKDFEYGIKRSADPKTASQEAYYMANIENYTAISKSQLSPDQLGVKAIGKYKLQIKLIKPQPYFLNLLVLPVFYPQSESVVKKYGKSYGTTSSKMIYNGAFKITNWTGTNDSWTLTKNKEYYNADKTKLDSIKYTVIKDPQTALNEYQSGKLDQTTLVGKQQYSSYKNSKDFHLRKIYSVRYLSLSNKNEPAFRNVNIRKALSLIINRKELLNDVLGNGSTQARGIVPDTLASRNGKDFNDYASVSDAVNGNVDQAKKLWKKGLSEIGKKNLTISINSNNGDDAKPIVEFIQNQFSKLPGLKVNLTLLPNTVATARFLSGQYQVAVTGWSPSISDPISPLNIRYSTNSMNTAKWSNAEYDKLIDKSNNDDALNPTKRWNDLVDAQKVLLNDQGLVPLFQPAQAELIKSDIHNVRFYGNGPIWDFSETYVK
ncbi:Dipeptide-binding protein DppE [Apilactobacillus kunkeei]|uniref:peptide ABC transporter substrate-binding protein n=1 Tax=Apilactobacillus kunkeei TaxID=148814 RepID=UPI00200B9D96|nr:peptide ABC transporter substrate-binding protein [Apilactobacillus kunkeei]MCK8629143.1 peptide ABC transporter substrate-binding protein [Apilactobacillus kunkeei]CAI2652946.1 Dipeptide-binding protein DppE [Apilactobacillus kunkeei]CAI2653390.1 Dipeptide-binding protein DppE [Apilactobacillus kunkeei]CAI2655565.1 Dipeptide-binding protein DppE [Apilactobacillus kunkeei]CAI2656549.1 Dipeptide-binding protein DppE [Apilactobacillus kunkeei]